MFKWAGAEFWFCLVVCLTTLVSQVEEVNAMSTHGVQLLLKNVQMGGVDFYDSLDFVSE